MRPGARPRPRADARPFYRERVTRARPARRRARRPASGVRATMPRCTARSPVRRSPALAVAVLGGRRAVGRSRPTARSRPSRRPRLVSCRLDVRAAVLLPLLGASPLAWWLWAVRRVDAAHPANPVPRAADGRVPGRAARARGRAALRHRALRHDPVLGPHGPARAARARRRAAHRPRRAVTLLLRRRRRATRRRWLLPILHSRVVRFLAFPVVAWVVFAAVMWATHFSPLFDAALEDPLVHDLEHGLFLGSACSSGGRPSALDPAPWRMAIPARIAVRVPPDDPEHVPRGRLLNAAAPSTRTTRRSARPWGDAARGPAAGGRGHVDRRRPDLPARDPAARRRLDARRGRATRPRVDRRADRRAGARSGSASAGCAERLADERGRAAAAGVSRSGRDRRARGTRGTARGRRSRR